MNQSPCLECPPEKRNYNSRRCMECEKRINYTRAIGGMTHSLPVNLSDLNKENKMNFKSDAPTTKKIEAKNNKRRIITEQDIEFISKNRKTMTYEQMGEHLDRKPSMIGYIIHRYIKNPKSKRSEKKIEIENDIGPGSGENMILLNFAGHEELYQQILSIAAEDFREPHLQALFMINEYCKRYKNAH